MERQFNYVYVTTNIKNGKRYIGDHSTDNLNDGYLGSGIILGHAIKKYGKENFKKEILEKFDTRKEAFDAQEKWINEYNTLRPNGYNISPKGGLNVKGCHSKETLEQISKNHSHYWLGKSPSQEVIEKRAKANTGKTRTQETKDQTRNSLLGIKHTEERKKNISNAHIGIQAGNKNPMFGISVYDLWVKKYGIEEANKRKESRRQKLLAAAAKNKIHAIS
jgi:group I intron endonuclease